MMMRVLLLAIIFLIASCATITVHQLTTTNLTHYKNENGVIYSLPLHVYDVTIQYDVISTEAPKHGVSKNELSKILGYPFPFYETDKKIKITTLSLKPIVFPDDSATYFVKLNSKRPFEKVKLDVSLNESNQIASLASESSSQLTPIAIAVIGTVVDVLIPGNLPVDEVSYLTETYKLNSVNGLVASTDQKKIHHQYKSIFDDKVESILNNVLASDDVKNAAIQLNLLNNEYLKLISTPNLSELNNRILILKDRINYYEEYLGGKKSIEKREYTTRLFPRVGNTFASRTVKLHNEVFYFIADFDSYKNINSKWRNFSRSDIPEGSGIFYRVPTKTTVALKIFAGNNESGVLLKDYQQEILVPQLGITRSLPRMTGYKKNQSYGIDPLTGALKTFSTSGKGLSDDETSTITSAINEVQNTRNKNLERKNKELELKLKQAELLQKLDSLKR